MVGGYLFVVFRVEVRGFVVFGVVDVGVIVEGVVSTADGSAASLVYEVLVEVGVGSMLSVFVLYKEWVLFRAEFF